MPGELAVLVGGAHPCHQGEAGEEDGRDEACREQGVCAGPEDDAHEEGMAADALDAAGLADLVREERHR